MAKRRMVLVLALLTASALLGAGISRWAEPAAHPFAQHALDRTLWSALTGTVQERIPAGPYTYLRVRSAEHDVWVVGLTAGSPRSDAVRVTVVGRADAFRSRRLQRTFDELLFGIVRPAESAQLKLAERN